MNCTEAYKEHIMYTFNGFCKVVIRYAAINAWRERSRRRQREISFEYLTEEKFYPFSTSDEYFADPYKEYRITICGQTIILTNGNCRCPVIVAKEKERNYLPLLFRTLYTTGNRGNIRKLPEYSMASHTQCLADVTERNGGAFTWGNLTLCLMKPLSERPMESRKPWTRFYSITADKSGLPPLKTGISTRTPRTA